MNRYLLFRLSYLPVLYLILNCNHLPCYRSSQIFDVHQITIVAMFRYQVLVLNNYFILKHLNSVPFVLIFKIALKTKKSAIAFIYRSFNSFCLLLYYKFYTNHSENKTQQHSNVINKCQQCHIKRNAILL